VARAVVLKGTTNRSTAGCTGGRAGTKLGPSISPLQEVANRARVSKRDQFGDQFREAGSGQDFPGVSISLVSTFS
jgi:hypothetical protein